MTLLVNHPQLSEIRKLLQKNIVLRRLKKRAFDELEVQLAVVDYRKGFGHTELVTVESVRTTV